MKNFKASLLVGALFLSVSNGASAIQPGVYKYVPSLLCETGDVAVKQNVNQKPMFSVGTSEAGALRLEIEKQSLSAYSDLGVAYFEQISRSQEYGFNEADTLEVEGEQVTYGSHSFLLLAFRLGWLCRHSSRLPCRSDSLFYIHPLLP